MTWHVLVMLAPEWGLDEGLVAPPLRLTPHLGHLALCLTKYVLPSPSQLVHKTLQLAVLRALRSL